MRGRPGVLGGGGPYADACRVEQQLYRAEIEAALQMGRVCVLLGGSDALGNPFLWIDHLPVLVPIAIVYKYLQYTPLSTVFSSPYQANSRWCACRRKDLCEVAQSNIEYAQYCHPMATAATQSQFHFLWALNNLAEQGMSFTRTT